MRKLKPSKKLKSSSKIKISACYIVKNEEANIKRSIDSLKSQVDEIIIVDTGSTDNTIAIAESCGAKVFTLPWQEDFSAPRNLALDNASGDWIIFLDADEFFARETIKNIRPTVEQAEKANKTGVLVNLVNIDVDDGNKILDTTYLLRIFKKANGIHYQGRIHEELQFADGKPIDNLTLAPQTVLTLYHTGYSSAINESKSRRNLKMLLAELNETKFPKRIYGYIAECYNGINDYVNAEKYALLDIEGGRRNTTFAAVSYRILLNILVKDPTRREDRLKISARAAKDFSELPEFHAEYAECLAMHGKFAEAINEMEIALKNFSSYKGIEPMMFDNEMAKFAKERLILWRSKLNEENQSK